MFNAGDSNQKRPPRLFGGDTWYFLHGSKRQMEKSFALSFDRRIGAFSRRASCPVARPAPAPRHSGSPENCTGPVGAETARLISPRRPSCMWTGSCHTGPVPIRPGKSPGC
ncbi:hypothetical protein VULLAG_LOCUS4939 [Vulpes lagopus]